MQLRLATPTDFPFIANSYLKSYRGSPSAKHLISLVYFDSYKVRLEEIMKHATVTVACSDEDPDQILGYLIAEQQNGANVVHYVYVKHVFRRMGVAKTLLKAVLPTFGARMSICTHTARHFNKLSEKYKLIYRAEIK